MTVQKTNNKLSTKKPVKTPAKESWWNINKEMLPFKAHYFLFFGAMGSAMPFLPVVARNEIGVSATSFAVVLTVQQFATILAKPLIGYIADYFGRLKLILIILIIIETIAYFSFLIIPPIHQTSSTLQAVGVFLKHEEHTKVVVTEISNCDISKFISIPKTSNSATNFDENKDKTDSYNMVCMKQLNESVTICYKQYIGGHTDMISFQKNQSCNCSPYISDIKTFTSSLKSVFTQQLRYLSVFELEVSKESINKTFVCASSIVQESSKIYLLNEPMYESQFKTIEFWIFALVFLISGIGYSCIVTLSDTACYESVHKYNSDFGRQRLFGSMSWGIISPIAGLLCDLTDSFLTPWIMFLILQVLAVWNIYKLDLIKPHFSQSICKDIGSVLKSFEFLAFDLAVFMNGFGAGIVFFYLTWFLSSIGGNEFLLGLVQYVQCFGGDIPLMFVSGWLIDKLGHFNLLSASLFCYAVRFLWYSYMKNPWMVLPMEIVHGFTYGTYYPAVASFGKLSAKPGTEATTQSILFTTHEGLGGVVGCVIAGIGFDYYGGHLTFYYLCLFSFGVTLLNLLNTFLLRKKNTQVLQVTKA